MYRPSLLSFFFHSFSFFFFFFFFFGGVGGLWFKRELYVKKLFLCCAVCIASAVCFMRGKTDDLAYDSI